MFAVPIQLVAAEHRTLDGWGGKGNAVALGGEVGSWNAEFHFVEPEIAVLPVRLFSAEAYRDGSASILAAGYHNVIVVKLRAGQVLGGRNADIVDAKRERAAFEFLYNLGGTVVRIERRFSKLDRQIRFIALASEMGVP